MVGLEDLFDDQKLHAGRAQTAWADAAGQWLRVNALCRHHLDAISRNQIEFGFACTRSLQSLFSQFAVPRALVDFAEYATDVTQRSILFTDAMYRRGNAVINRGQQDLKPALAFDYDLVIDGRTLERPVNYALVRIQPPAGYAAPREDARPWVIIDPRAGHGSGIGGFKSESEVGVALRGGHPVYFVIFFPDPEPDQTLADVCHAEAAFLQEVHHRHPHSPRPLVTGNCQGGWATMILAATHPGLMGPVVIAGAPLSYWAGKQGRNPFRYLGGMAGGAVPALVMSDLGGGRFDGANLVFNFELLNPGKTLWRKNFDLFSAVDSEAERFLEFEKWWSGFYFMNQNEIRWIVENLFIGNKLTRGEAVLNDGTRIDLKRIEAPVVVFASHGDNITPPQQALNWIADLYESDLVIQAHGHIIIYTLHDSIGHLGIFVSAQVANERHEQIGSVVKTIESLAPGLYEMIVERDEHGIETVSFEARKIDDILRFDDGREEEVEFAAVAKFSEWATMTYEMTLQPVIRSVATPVFVEAWKRSHPIRQQQYFFSRKNPLLAGIESLADQTRAARAPAAKDNPFAQLEGLFGTCVEHGANLYRDVRDATIELAFFTLYGTPWMKHLGSSRLRESGRTDLGKVPHVQDAIGRLRAGGYAEGIIRMLILLARARGSVRRERLERSDRLLHSRPPFDSMPPERRSRLIYEQSLIVEFAGQEALTTLPELLSDPVDRYRALNFVFDIVGPAEEMDTATLTMFKRLQHTLLAMAKEWRDLSSGPAATAVESIA